MADDVKDTSVDAAEESLLAMLTGDNSDDTGAEGAADDEETPDEEESDEDAETSADDDGDSDEESDEESEDDGEDDDHAPKIVPEDAVAFTIPTEDGTNKPVTAGEAKAGYLRQADYSRKTAEVADDRKAIQTERLQLDEALRNVLAVMDGEDAETTPAKLAELARTDPEAATRLRFDREARAEQRAKVDAARAELAKRTQQELLDAAKKVQVVELGKLMDAFPEMKVPEKAKAVLTRLTQAAVHVGFEEADMNRITDHRLMKLLDLAATGLRLSARKAPKPDAKGSPIRALTPGSNARNVGNRSKAQRDAQFQKSRSPDDAADSLMAAMEAVAKRR